jgi:anti-sigma factor RsiW
MTCQTLRDAIVDVARGEPVGPGTEAAIEAHVQFCAQCAASLERERALSDGLRALASSAMAQPSPEIETALQRAFAEHHAERSFAFRVVRRHWLRAAAIVIAVAGAVVWWRTSAAPSMAVDPKSAQPAAQPKMIFAEGFVPLPVAAGLPDFESGEIVRVEIPVASLPTYGIEIVPDARRAPVQADLLVGQDGQARAIRLVGSANGGRTMTP